MSDSDTIDDDEPIPYVLTEKALAELDGSHVDCPCGQDPHDSYGWDEPFSPND